ncbi:UvrB/UvrC motif-containing protein [Dehalobacterium formicoaceticum]|uniref:UvrB/UvrC motif-containing protein n=1 Tax=Dehalobacterium formicoaceticum TaxID=51515 RepID=A0ABT1XZ63_9FIRM|nr:UvrB/UvrC motif-containing protein [Dehalobacterium formicoaceticum]MCR6543919.1 UvrB/UvrC motif-containing protein [Dehalobacterium formicoaceticum]
MLCDKCKQNQATMHFTKIINNEKYEQHLCEECAHGSSPFAGGMDPKFSFNNFLSNFLTHDPAISGMKHTDKLERCENCGLTYDQFAEGGKLGCSNCYSVFQDKLNPLIRRIHSSEIHKGKVPERTGGHLKILKEIDSLKSELNTLISKEEFEKAAVVRDKIKDLEMKMAD